jgi:hypothetical protein
LDLPKFDIPSLSGGTVNISFSDSFIGILNCEDNFLDASGLSLETFGITGFIRQFEQTLDDALSDFDINSFLGDSTGNLGDISGNINIAEDIGEQVDTLKDSLEVSIGTFFQSALILELSDFEDQSNLITELNTLLGAEGSTFTVVDPNDVFLIAPFAYMKEENGDVARPDDFRFPGQITTVGKGPNYDAVFDEVTDPISKNKIWGNRARDEPPFGTKNAPGTVGEDALVYKLSRMNAGDPIFARDTYDDYQLIRIELDNLVNSVNDTEKYIVSIFDLEDRVNAIIGGFNDTYVGTLSTIKTFVFNAIDRVVDRVEGAEALDCVFIGDYYRTAKKSYCSNLRTALGGTAVVSLIMVFVLFVSFFVVMWTDILSFRKDNDSEYESDDSFEDDRKYR